MNENHTERDIKIEQHQIPPILPEDPDGLEIEKRQTARMIPVVVIALAVVMIAVMFVVI